MDLEEDGAVESTINNKCNNKCDVIELLFEPETKVKPSEYIRELQLITPERHKKQIQKSKRNNHKTTELGQRPFVVTPDVIIFQCFCVGTEYNVQLKIQNRTKISQHLRQVTEDSPYFDIMYILPSYDVSPNRLAPGMTAIFNIKFIPEELRDYNHRIRFFIEGGTLDIPIYGIGPRPLIDIPDYIWISAGAVNIPSEKLVVIRNFGKIATSFKLLLKEPFFVTPTEGVLIPFELLQLKLEYRSHQTGTRHERMIMCFDNTEKVCVDLIGSAENVNVFLEKNSMQMGQIYVTLSCQKSFKIFNKSAHKVEFHWKQHPNRNIQDEEKVRYEKLFTEVSEREKQHSGDLQYHDIATEDGVDVIQDRILEDELVQLESPDSFVFIDPNFSISPKTGVIYPSNDIEITITFRPKDVAEYEAKAYCEISGLDNRLPLTMHGIGQGPTVLLNVVQLDVGHIFLCGKHTYEIVFFNKSDVPALIKYTEKPTTFGGRLGCFPNSFMLDPYKNKACNIVFSSTHQGNFIEDVTFNNVRANTVLTCTIRGIVLTPRLKFDVKELKFGLCSLGFPTKKLVQMHNNSQTSVAYKMRILGDGTHIPVTCEMFANAAMKPVIPYSPREISVSPMFGKVEPMSSVYFDVTIIPNKVGKFEKKIMVDMWETETESEALNIFWSSEYPRIICEPGEITIPFCFVHHAYARTIVLTNTTDLQGYFYILPQEISSDTSIVVSLGLSERYLESNGTIEIPITIIASNLGATTIELNALVFGQDIPTLLCTIRCTGRGPVLSLEPDDLNLGDVPLLTSVTDKIQIISDSPIPAEFKIYFERSNTPFKISQTEGTVAPGQVLTLDISCFLIDTGNFQDRLILKVLHGQTVKSNVIANGVGTSIEVEPLITPEFDFGPIFTLKTYEQCFTFYNRAMRPHRIAIRKLETRKTNLGKLKKLQGPIKFIPDKFGLSSEGSSIVFIEILSETVGYIEETWIVEAVIGTNPELKQLFSFSVKANLIEPALLFSSQEIFFRVDKANEIIFYQVENSVNVENKCVIPLTVQMNLNHPFYILDSAEELQNSLIREIMPREVQTIRLYFKCNDWNMHKSYRLDSKLGFGFADHKKKEYVQLHADVYFPNIELSPKTLEFACIPNQENQCFSVTIRNVTPLPVNFTWKWKESKLKVEFKENISDKVTEDATEMLEITDLPLELEATYDVLEVTDRDGTIPPDVTLQETSTNVPSTQNEITRFLEDVHATDFVIDNPEKLTAYLKRNLFNLCQSWYKTPDPNELEVYSMLPQDHPIELIHSLFDVTPFFGVLEPFEVQSIRVAFHPSCCLTVIAELQCFIEGGPIELLPVKALAANVSYYVENTLLDFGRKLFGGTYQKFILLKNTGVVPFNFVVLRSGGEENYPEIYLMNAGYVSVEPKAGIIGVNKTEKIVVKYFPGISGRFMEVFSILIEHENLVQIKVTGFGGFSQIYLPLPRLTINQIPRTVCYKATASLTKEWLRTITNMNQLNMDDLRTYYDQDIPDTDEDQLEEEEWDIVYLDKNFPTRADIELAIERFVCYHHIQNHPDCLNQLLKCKAITNFYPPAYCFDFGAVVVGASASFTIFVLNYGPTVANIRLLPLSKASGMRHSGLIVVFDQVCKLPIGETVPLHIIFNPKRDKYKEKVTELEYMIYLEVDHGGRIPIQIKGLATIPILTFEPLILDFGNVRCGDAFTQSIILKNEGRIGVNWKAQFLQVEKQVFDETLQRFRERLPNQFRIVGQQSTHLEPGEEQDLCIQFEPSYSGNTSMKLQFLFEGNEIDKPSLLLRGFGQVPVLELSDNCLIWNSVLPWGIPEAKKIIIKNSGEINVEFFIPDFDNFVQHEEQITKLLTLGYNKEKLYLPPRGPGESFPSSLYDLSRHLIHDSIQSQPEQGSRFSSGKSAKIGLAASPSKAVSAISLKGTKPSKTLTLDGMLTSFEAENTVLNLLKQNISKGLVLDPEREAWKEYQPPDIEEPSNINIMIIFNGSKLTNSVEIANRAGRLLNLDVVNIDKLIIAGLMNPPSNLKDLPQIFEYKKLVDNSYKAQMDWYLNRYKDVLDQHQIEKLSSNVEPKDPDQFYNQIKFIINPPIPKLTTASVRSSGNTSMKSRKNKSSKRILNFYGPSRPVQSSSSSSTKSSAERTPRELYYKSCSRYVPSMKSGYSKAFQRSEKNGSRRSRAQSERKTTEASILENVDITDVANVETFLNIGIGTLLDLLRHGLQKYKSGLIIEDLSTSFFRSPLVLLQALLQFAGKMQYIHVISFYLPSVKLALFVEAQKTIDAEKAKIQLNDKMINFENMTEKEYSEMPEEERKAYEENVLKVRKYKYEQRLLDLLNKNASTLDRIHHYRYRRTFMFLRGGMKRRRRTEVRREEKKKEDVNNYQPTYETKVKPKKRKSRKKKEDSDIFEEDPEKRREIQGYKDQLVDLENWENNLENITNYLEVYDKTRKGSLGFKAFSRSRQRQPSIRSVRSGRKKKKKTEEELSKLRDDTQDSDIGIPHWLVNYSQPDDPQASNIPNMLLSIPELESTVKDLHSLKKPKIKHCQKRFTVYSQPKKREIMKQNVFVLQNEMDVKALRPQSSERFLRGRNSRKFNTERLSRSPRTASSENDFTVSKTRGVLQPGESTEYQILFKPKLLGSYEHTFTFEIQGFSSGQISVICKGVCEIPHLDTEPKTVFSSVKDRKSAELEMVPTYFTCDRVLDFGGTVLQKNPSKTCVPRKCDAVLMNISNLPCEIHFTFLDPKNCFKIQPNNYTIQPGESENVRITAQPTQLGRSTNQLCIFIKDNPKIEIFNLSIFASKFDCEPMERKLQFERILVFRKVQKAITFKNKGIMPLLWQFVNHEQLKPLGLDFSAIQGLIKPMSEIKIGVEYTGYKAQALREDLIYEIYEDHAHGEPLARESIEITAESFDVEIDVFFAEPDYTHVQFGNIKVMTPYQQKFCLFNRGFYPVDYKLDLIPNKALTKQQITWGIEPLEGVLEKENLTPIIIGVQANQSVAIKKSDIITVHITDTSTKERVAQFPIQVSLCSFYSQYEICPDILDFGSVLLGDVKSLQISIKNTGKFGFQYLFESEESLRAGALDSKDKRSKRSKGSSKKSNSKKTADESSSKRKKHKKENKSSTTELKLETCPSGIFTVMDANNSIPIGESSFKHIEVTCSSNISGTFKEKFYLRISESLQQIANQGHEIQVVAEVTLPNVPLNDFLTMFRECYITPNNKEMSFGKKSGFTAFFIKNERCLMFKRACVNKTVSTRIWLKNVGSLQAQLNLSYESSGSHHQNQELISNGPFTAKPKLLVIEPYAEEMFEISFLPRTIEKYTATLTINLVLPSSVPSKSFTFKLIGEGQFPQIVVTQPEDLDIKFPMCHIDTKSENRLQLRNSGELPSNVILKITNDDNENFELRPSNDTIDKVINISDSLDVRNLLLNMDVDDEANILIRFNSTEKGTVQANLHVLIVDNPFENKKISLKAESFLEDIYIAGIPIKKRIQQRRRSMSRTRSRSGSVRSMTSVASPIRMVDEPIVYEIDFGNVHVHEMKTFVFKICNCTKFNYKFELEFLYEPQSKLHDLSFLPNQDVIGPNESKEVVVSHVGFVAKSVIKVYLNMNFWIVQPDNQIPVHEPSKPKVVLQSVGSNSSWKRRSVEPPEPRPEPIYIKDPSSKKTFNVVISANICDVSFKTNVQRAYVFSDTLLFDCRRVIFFVRNASPAPITIDWYLKETNRVKPVKYQEDLSQLGIVKFRPPSSRARKKPKLAPLSGKEHWLHVVNEKKSTEPRENFNFDNSMYTAFTIEPDYVVIPPHKSQDFTLIFQPIDPLHYESTIISDIKYLPNTLSDISISLTGKGLIPFCHFDTEFSDYISCGRRDSMKEFLPGDWKVVEMYCLGVNVEHARQIKIINPSDVELSYSWTRLSKSGDLNQFYCHRPNGLIESKRFTICAFSFFSPNFGTFEEQFSFEINNFRWKEQFLFVAHVRQPKVSCGNALPLIKFKPTILGFDETEELILRNDEPDNDFQFKFDELSLHAVEYGPKLSVSEMDGILKKNSQKVVNLKYKAGQVGESKYNVKVYIFGIPKPIEVYLQTCCYALEVALFYDKEAFNREEIQVNKPFHLKKDKLVKGISICEQFTIENRGKTKFFYVWNINCKDLDAKFEVEVNPDKGSLKAKENEICEMTIKPLEHIKKDNIPIVLEVAYGPRFQIYLDLNSLPPAYKFSFTKYKFGKCFIRPEPQWAYRQLLEFKNNDVEPITLEFMSKNTNFINIDVKIETVGPGETMSMEVYFQPREKIHYKYVATFSVGENMVDVVFEGEGIELLVDLANPEHSVIDFGELPVHRKATKHFEIHNHSIAPITLQVNLQKKMMATSRSTVLNVYDLIYTQKSTRIKSGTNVPSVKSKKSKSSKATKSIENNNASNEDLFLDYEQKLQIIKEQKLQEQQVLQALSVTPSETLTIPAGKSVPISVTFNSSVILKPFQEIVGLQVFQDVLPLVIVKGSTTAAQVVLSRQNIAFPTTLKGCNINEFLLLQNKGTTATKFSWEFKTHENLNMFRILPEKGFITPGTDIRMIVEFAPTEISNCVFKEEAICRLSKEFPPLILILTGRCEDLPPILSTISMKSTIRGWKSTFIDIENNSNTVWNINPVITGENFSCSEQVTIQPFSTNSCEVTYHPKLISQKDLDTGTITFKFPDGKAARYALEGTPEKPLPFNELNITISSKVPHTELLKIENWLTDSQTFTILTEQTNTGSVPFYKVLGHEFIEVPSKQTKEYEWTIFAFNSGTLIFKVGFVNAETRDYLYYNITVNVKANETLETVSLETACRKSVTYEIVLENPTPIPLQINPICTNAYIKMPPGFTLPEHGKVAVPLTYSPVIEEDTLSTLQFKHSPVIGSFDYILNLHALPAENENLTEFEVDFGKTVPASVEISNLVKVKSDFNITSTMATVFNCPKTISVSPMSSTKFEIMFDPINLGTVEGLITANSTTSGIFNYPVKGTAIFPKYQGPFTLRPRTEFTFRNPFNRTMYFSLKSEPKDLIQVKGNEVEIKSKMEQSLVVSLTEKAQQVMNRPEMKNHPITGKVTIAPLETSLDYLSWSYYFQSG